MCEGYWVLRREGVGTRSTHVGRVLLKYLCLYHIVVAGDVHIGAGYFVADLTY